MWGLHPDYFDALFAGVVTLVPLLLGVYLLAPYLATHHTPGPGVTALLQLLAAAGRCLGLASSAASVPGERARLLARYCTVLYCTVLYCTVLCCAGQEETPRPRLHPRHPRRGHLPR